MEVSEEEDRKKDNAKTLCLSITKSMSLLLYFLLNASLKKRMKSAAIIVLGVGQLNIKW